MLGYILLALSLVTIQARPQSSDARQTECPAQGHWLLPHEYDCNKFYYCEYGVRASTATDCALGTQFSYDLQVCIHPMLANCQLSGIPPSTEAATAAPTTTEDHVAEVILLPNGCPADFSIHHLLPHETDCALFYYCNFGELVLRECGPGTHFNFALQVCDWPQNAGCANSGGGGETTTTAAPTTSTTTAAPSTTTEAATTTTSAPTTTEAATTTTEGPGEVELLPNGCPVDFSIHRLLPHETECNLFYYCNFGELVLRECGPGTHFNPVLQVCDWPENAGCINSGTTTEAATTSTTTAAPSTTEAATTTTSAPTTTEAATTTTEGPGEVELLPNGCPVDFSIHRLLPHETECNLFYYCNFGELVLRECGPGTHFNPVLQVCDWPENAGCINSGTTTEAATTSTTTAASSTTEAATTTTSAPTTTEAATTTTEGPGEVELLPNGCPVDFSIHRLLPHETECNLFYYCNFGELVLRECGPGTHFNPVLQVCDWPENAGCINSGTTTEAATTSTTTAAPSTTEEATTTTSAPTTTEAATTTTTTEAPSTTSAPTTTEAATTTTEGPGEVETLPNGCPADFSIYLLLPHETNCSLFYYCDFGEKVLRECAIGTHFNAAQQVCDWPENAGCINSGSGEDSSETTTTDAATTSTTTAAPSTTEAATTTTSAPTTTEATTTTTTTEAPSTTEAVTTTTSAPTTTEAATTTTEGPGEVETLPNGCPADFSIYLLLPHETNCSLFYYCDYGEKVLRECAIGTHFNAAQQVCDWPENAGCINSGSGEDSGEDSSETTTTEAATTSTTTAAPSTTEEATTTTSAPTTTEVAATTTTTEAPSTTEEENVTTTLSPTTTEAATTTTEGPGEVETLPNGCPADFSIYLLLPHETNCSLFYYCDFGEKVLRECAIGTHFNAEQQVCDWPENAGCINSGSGEDSSETTTTEAATSSTTTAGPSTTEAVNVTTTTSSPTTTEGVNTTTSSPTTTEAATTTTEGPGEVETLPNGCPADFSIYLLLPHETNCSLFYYCDFGEKVLRECAIGTHFNAAQQVCDWPENAGCINSGSGEDSSETTTTEAATTSTTTAAPSTTEAVNVTTTTSSPTTTESVNVTTTTSSPTTTESVNVTTTTSSPTTTESVNVTTTTSSPTTTESVNVTTTTSSPTTTEGVNVTTTTASPTTTEAASTTTEGPGEVDTLPNGCPANFSDYQLLPHETNCSLFYICEFGDKVLRECAHGTHFNPILQVCDWPEYAGCVSSGNSTEDGDSSEENDTDSCAGKCNVLPWAHETDCDKFWRCDGDKTVLTICSEGLHFNSETYTCDFICNVHCERNAQATIQRDGVRIFLPWDNVDSAMIQKFIGKLNHD